MYGCKYAWVIKCWESKVISNIAAKLRRSIQNSQSPVPLPWHQYFLHWIKSSGVKIRPALKNRYLFHEPEDLNSRYCENNYSR